VPYADNAYHHLHAAVTRLQGPSDARVASSLEEWDDALIGNVLSRNGEVLTLLEQAVVCPGYRADGGAGSDSWLRLSLFLAQKAAYERRIGLSDVACESSCCLLRLGAWIILPAIPCRVARRRDGFRTGFGGPGAASAEQSVRRSGPHDVAGAVEPAEVSDRGLAEAFKMEFQSVREAIDACALRYPGRSLLNVYRFQPNRTREDFARFYRR
jgi:hypothetical protein